MMLLHDVIPPHMPRSGRTEPERFKQTLAKRYRKIIDKLARPASGQLSHQLKNDPEALNDLLKRFRNR